MSASSKVIVIVKLSVPTFPAASVAIHVTVVLPIGNVEPPAGEQVGPEATPYSSDAETENVIIRPAELEVEFVRLDGTNTVGGVVSAQQIVTVNVPVPEFPAASVAVHVTVVVPSGKVEPSGGWQVIEVTPTLSVALTLADSHEIVSPEVPS